VTLHGRVWLKIYNLLLVRLQNALEDAFMPLSKAIVNPSGTGYFWRKDGSVAKFSGGENCILLSESQGLAY